MVVAQIIGGLGNQLFQYAAGKALAQHHNVDFCIDTTPFKSYSLHDCDLNFLKITAPEVSEQQMKEFCIKKYSTFKKTIYRNLNFLISPKRNTYYEETFPEYNNRFFDLPPHIYLSGYFQSEKYFERITHIIKQEFVLKQNLTNTNGVIDDIKNTNSVSIHFRRGNYATNDGIRNIFGLVGLEYYKQAVENILSSVKNPHFFIFTNDSEWVKSNFKIEDYPVTYVSDLGFKNHEELFAMSLCKHNIIANSTFSWWAAWLNNNPDKMIVSPDEWFKWKKIRNKDLLPKDWIKIPAHLW